MNDDDNVSGAPTGARGELRDLSKLSAEQANMERRRRIQQRWPPVNLSPTDEEKRLGMNGAKQATGAELARLDVLAGARVSYADLLRSLQKFEVSVRLYPNAENSWQAYEGMYNRLRIAAETVAQLSNETLHIPAPVIRPAHEFVSVAPGLRPDAEPREVKPGLKPVAPDPWAVDGIDRKSVV